MRVETLKSPLGEAAVEGEGYGSGFGFPSRYKGRVHKYEKKPRGENVMGREDTDGKEGGPGPPPP